STSGVAPRGGKFTQDAARDKENPVRRSESRAEGSEVVCVGALSCTCTRRQS
ncbi:unnamed protein product, partial [Polarella glacialis]